MQTGIVAQKISRKAVGAFVYRYCYKQDHRISEYRYDNAPLIAETVHYIK